MKEKKLNLQLRDDVIYWRYLKGATTRELAEEYFYTQNYISSIIRKYKKRFENNRRKKLNDRSKTKTSAINR